MRGHETGAQELVTRRTVLRAGAAGGAALAVGGLPAWARARSAAHRRPHRPRPDELPYPDRPMGEPGIPQIETLVLVMLENHSADNILGMLPHTVKSRRRDFDGLPANRHGIPIATNPDGKGGVVRSFRAPDMCASDGLTQAWDDSHRQYNNGANDGFVRNTNSKTPMSYYTADQLPVTYALASHFPVSDRYFCSLLGQTLPNRRYYFAGTSDGTVNDDPGAFLVNAKNGTIFDRMDAAKVSWKVYYNYEPSPYYFPNFRDNPLQVLRCVPNSQFYTDAAAGRLPSVAYMEENFNFQSEENPQDVAYGEAFLRAVVEACMNSPQWDKMALIVTYDEHGGYYDHVPPPRAVLPDSTPPIISSLDGASFRAAFDRYGFRVPFTVVSPWGQPNYVSHQVADHTSVLAFIEDKWNLPPMTHRDAGAWNLRDMFDVSRPRLAAPFELPPAPDVPATLAQCRADGHNPPTSANPGTYLP